MVGGHVATPRGESIDFACNGEGPTTIEQLLIALKSVSPNYAKVEGLVWRDGERRHVEDMSRHRRRRKLVDELAFLYVHPGPQTDAVCFATTSLLGQARMNNLHSNGALRDEPRHQGPTKTVLCPDIDRHSATDDARAQMWPEEPPGALHACQATRSLLLRLGDLGTVRM